jgi:hypothetical protein
MRGRVALVGAAILLHITVLFSARHHFPTVDELAHLPAGISHWEFERFDLYSVNPPLVRLIASLPAWLRGDEYEWSLNTGTVGSRPEFAIGQYALQQNGLELATNYRAPRIVAMGFSLVGLYLLSSWLWKELGPGAGIVALLLWSFSPDLLAHGATIGPDVGAVSLGVLACIACWHYARAPTRERAFWAGGALGLAMLTKLTWLTAMITLPATVCLSLIWSPGEMPRRRLHQFGLDLLIFWCAAGFTLNAGYLFDGTFTPLRELEFCSEALGGEGSNALRYGNRFKESILGRLRTPFPRDFLLGIDYLKYEVEQKKWSFLMGEWRFGSWPHYYIMTTVFKTPEATILAVVIGLSLLLISVNRKEVEPRVLSMFLFLGLPAGVAFGSVSLQGGFNHHHRYVLQIYPFFFALAAYIASPVAIMLLRFRLPLLGSQKHSIAVPLAVTLVALSAASSLRVHPYYTSYFNTLSGGPENGWRLLGFSNIDWGQDILEVDKWLKRHPDRRPLVMDLDYFSMNGELFDVPTSRPPRFPKGTSIDSVRRTLTETQWWIISVKRLYNYPGQDGLEYLQQIEPFERIAYGYHVYRIDPLEADVEQVGTSR